MSIEARQNVKTMTERHTTRTAEQQDKADATPSPSQSRAAWQEPTLKFVEPKLTKQGDMKQITAGFIGTFVP